MVTSMAAVAVGSSWLVTRMVAEPRPVACATPFWSIVRAPSDVHSR
jgi:hypothetical protein